MTTKNWGGAAAAWLALASGAAAQEPGFYEWLEGFRAEAAAAGLRAETIARAFDGVVVNQRVFELNDNQPEFASNVWDYIDRALSERRVSDGRLRFSEQAATLDAIEADYAVDKEIIAAIWGVESSYGALLGDHDVISALATLAWKGRRTAYGREQLIGALRIIEAGYADRLELKGSWAGAMGQTQFIPTTYLAYAVDRDADGRRDIWRNLGDVFASTANYLKASGYAANAGWGVEVILPEGFDYALADPAVTKAMVEWSAAGVKAAGKSLDSFDPNKRGRVIVPAGARGPAFLVFENFEAILKYNRSVSYALGVAMLGDVLAGRSTPLATEWPRGDRALTLAERKAVQQALKDKGFDPGPVDGVLGAGSKRALRDWQKSVGLPADGYASAETLARLTS